MNAFIDLFNDWGARCVRVTLPALIQSSALIAVLFLLDLALRNRVRAVTRYALWMLVLVKLVLPPSLALPIGVGYWLGTARPEPAPPGSFAVRYDHSPRDPVGAYERFTNSTPSPTWKRDGLLLLIWMSGTLSLLCCVARRTITARRIVSEDEEASPELKRLSAECAERMGMRKPIRLGVTDETRSPAVCGLLHPSILLPRQLADRLSALQLRAVLLHELAHIQRRDVWVNYAQTLVQLFYWWHPLLWLANAHIRRVREQAVDENVMVQMREEGGSYAATLLEVARLALRSPLPALGLIGIVETRSALARRIQHLLDRPAPQSAKLSLASLAAILIAGALLVPMAQGQRRERNTRTGQPSGLEAGNNLNPPQSIAEVAPGSDVVVTVAESEPYFYLGSRAVTVDELKEELALVIEKNPNAALSIRADTAAPIRKIVEVMDAAKSAGLKIVSLTRPQAGQIGDKVQINITTKSTNEVASAKAAGNTRVESTKAAISELKRRLETEDDEARREALIQFGFSPQTVAEAENPTLRDALPILVAATKDKSDGIRSAAVHALWRIRSSRPEAIQALCALMLKDKNVNTATIAASTLKEMGRAAAPAVPSLIETLQEQRDDGTLRRAVIVALGNIGPAAKEAVPILRERFKDQGEFSLGNRVFSAKALWLITGKTDESLPVLVSALKDEDSFWAADILGLMGADAKSAIPDLQSALQNRVGYTRLRAALALTRIDPQFPLPMTLLLELLGDPNPITRVETAGIIWSVNHDPQVIVPTLLGLIKPDEQDPTGYGACEQAIALLGEIGPPAKAAIPALKTLQQSPNSHIRGLAAEALKKIEAQTEAKPQAAPLKGQ